MKNYSQYKFTLKERILCFEGMSAKEKRDEIKKKMGWEKYWLSKVEGAKLTSRIKLEHEQLTVLADCLNCTIDDLINPKCKEVVLKSLPLKKSALAAA